MWIQYAQMIHKEEREEEEDDDEDENLSDFNENWYYDYIECCEFKKHSPEI